MARSQSNGASNIVKWAGAAAFAIVGGIGIGYLFGNARVTHPTVQTVQPPVSTTLTPTPSPSPSSIHPHTANGNYTAPGAPHIVIEEERPTYPAACHAAEGSNGNGPGSHPGSASVAAHAAGQSVYDNRYDSAGQWHGYDRAAKRHVPRKQWHSQSDKSSDYSSHTCPCRPGFRACERRA